MDYLLSGTSLCKYLENFFFEKKKSNPTPEHTYIFKKFTYKYEVLIAFVSTCFMSDSIESFRVFLNFGEVLN